LLESYEVTLSAGKGDGDIVGKREECISGRKRGRYIERKLGSKIMDRKRERKSFKHVKGRWDIAWKSRGDISARERGRRLNDLCLLGN
jgi:hypothetical protein